MSKNAEGWIRHRGGKCPVEAGVKVDYRMRDGEIDCFGHDAGRLQWSHEPDDCDIMAYKLHKPAEQVEACSKPELRISLPENYGEIMGRAEDGPLQWRDRITEIDATTQALTTERAELVQKLASEGFALIGRINELLTEAAQKHEDMSDWRNWKVGDFVTIEGNSSYHKLKTGEIARIKSLSYEDGCGFSIEHIDSSDFWYVDYPDLSWHSRPSA